MSKKIKKDIQFEQPSDILLLFDHYLMFILGFMVLAILVSGYLFVLKPKIDDMSSIKIETTETEDRRIGNEKLLSRIKELESEYQDIMNNRQADLEFLKKMVPYGLQEPEFLLLADRLAKKHDFQLSNIDISPNDNKNIQKQASETTGATSTPAKIETLDDLLTASGIKSATIKLSVSKTIVEGSDILGKDIYNDFKNYLSELENSLRLLDVQSIDFLSIAAESQTAATYNFNLDLITYYQ
ncbi:MAG: hypothetical protein WCS88_01555 [Patescibacteria group bacterium]|jgi:hypothetical protein